MLTALTLCLVAPTQGNSWLPLTSPGTDDGATAQVLAPSGDHLYVSHGVTGTVTKIDTATGQVMASVSLGLTGVYPSTGDMDWISGSSEFVIVDSESGQVTRVDGASMTVTGTAVVSIQAPWFVDVNPQGTFAIVSSQSGYSTSGMEQVSVLNLATMLEERLIEYPHYSRASTGLWEVNYFAADGATIVGIAGTSSQAGTSATIQARDVQTGGLVGEHRFGAATPYVTDFAISDDRTTLYAAAFGDQAASVRPEAVRLSAGDAGLLNQIQFTGSHPSSVKLGLDGTRAWGVILPGSSIAFPIDQPVVAPNTPGVITYPVDSALLNQVIQGGDRVLIQNSRGELKLCSGAGALLETIKAPLYRYDTAFAENNGRAPILTAWVDGSQDRVAILNLGSSSGAPRFRSVNTGAGQEFDGPFAFEIDPLSDRAVVVASGSDNVAVVDLPTRRVTAIIPTATKPSALEITPDGRALIGHQDGVVATIDPSVAAESGRFQLDGDVVLIAADPAGTRAWVRVDATPSHPFGCALLRVETAGAGAGELARIPLPGPSRVSRVMVGANHGISPLARTPDARSVAIDYARALAYVAVPRLNQIDVVDLQARTILRSYSVLLQRDRSDLEVSADGTRLVVATESGARLFSIGPMSLVPLTGISSIGHTVAPPSFAFSSDGSTVLINSNDHGGPLWTSAGLKALDAVGAAGRNVALDTGTGAGFALDDDRIAFVRGGEFLTTTWSNGPSGAHFSTPEFLTRVTDPLTAPRINAARRFAAIMGLGTVDGHDAPGLTIVNLAP